MSPDAADTAFLKEIISRAQRALRYVGDMAVDRFHADTLTQDAVLWNLAVIGEAANRMTARTKAVIDVPWADIIGQRHIAIHHYMKLDMRRIWTTVRTDLPPLIAAIERHLTEHP
jgi:uncharacterized protein with HEPN domain